MKYFLVGFLLAVVVGLAFAKSPTDYALVIPVGSKHYGGDGVSKCGLTQANNPAYRERNLGIGLKGSFDRQWAVEVGYYQNSAWKETVYAVAKWTPVDYQWVRLGVGFGGGTGYCAKPVLFMAGAVVTVDVTKNVGFDVVAIPPIGRGTEGVVGLQLRLSF